ncbi:D-2-hydroxyacid dehydrogenase [Halomonas piscis]|uniref:D-2-hydroxyacid dehydrogenase n=1 Tax=Halomonas piscis TaxID=3031727 RepID=A0ABY9YWS7_9GAMM|nr:D-2-hydroxyacid dehydrogenase [Halomonas piscis]WNK18936.1 D-2-hydroxyacid dehydrogenase [Halomonas piscis]
MTHAVLLDAQSLGEAVDLAPLRDRVDRLTVYDQSNAQNAGDRLADADVAIVNKVVLDAETLSALPRLKLICVLATGLNNIAVDAAEARGIAVKNVTGYGTGSVSQHAMMLMLALANRLPRYQRDVADDQWQQSDFFCLQHHPTLELAGKHLVIVGQGELGNAVAGLAEAFSMRTSFCARPGNEADDPRPTLETLLPEADVLSLHCPLTEATRHLIDRAALKRARPSLLLINCARGGIIDEHAALEALRDGRLGGLGVDTLPHEPPRDGHALLEALDEPLNLIVTPHNAWITPEARQKIVALTADNLAEWQSRR